MPAKARIAQKDGKAYLVRCPQGDQLQPLAASAEDLAAVAGKQVDFETGHTVLGVRGVDDQVRAYLLKQFVAERIIAQEVYERLVG